jgi:hypothetical protein
VPVVARERREVAEVAGVGELVEVDDGLAAAREPVEFTKLAPMKPAPPVTRIVTCPPSAARGA